ncbi:hypothetical protein [Aquimarina aggregata]|uniref:hypothetical protein n=1 Tax=Aquimarina aggregata TaxID=1642818 RepID=UPI00082C90BB|nr:hypothetical protein [Aquimarina aggregata]
METIKPQENQSIFDMALQEYGSIEGLFDLLDDNTIDQVDMSLSVYQDLQIISSPTRREIQEFYIARNIKPATDGTNAEFALLEDPDKDCEGIGCMIIADDFIVCPADEEEPKLQEIKGFGGISGEGISLKLLQNNIGYRKVGSDELPKIITFSRFEGDNITPYNLEFSIFVEANATYEILAASQKTPINVAVSIPIDKTRESINVFNSSQVLKALSEGKNFNVKFFVALQES